MIYVALDSETTGLSDKCSLIELAMVIEDTAQPLVPLDKLERFHCYVRHDGAYWESYALKMHNCKEMMIAQFYNNVATPACPIYTLAEMEEAALDWLAAHGMTSTQQATVAGKNYGTFDRRFLPERLAKVFNRRYIDPACVGLDWSRKDLPSMKDLIGFEPSHNALDDAYDVIKVLRRDYT